MLSNKVYKMSQNSSHLQGVSFYTELLSPEARVIVKTLQYQLISHLLCSKIWFGIKSHSESQGNLKLGEGNSPSSASRVMGSQECTISVFCLYLFFFFFFSIPTVLWTPQQETSCLLCSCSWPRAWSIRWVWIVRRNGSSCSPVWTPHGSTPYPWFLWPIPFSEHAPLSP